VALYLPYKDALELIQPPIDMFKSLRVAVAVLGFAAPALSAQTILIDAGHYHDNYGADLWTSIANQLQVRSTNGGSGLLMYWGGDLSAQNLSSFSAVWFGDGALYNYDGWGNDATLTAFLNAGGSLGVEGAYDNQVGVLNGVLGFDIGAASIGGGGGCYDDQQITAAGVAYGLSTNNPGIGCYGHGALDQSLFPANWVMLEDAGNSGGFPGYAGIMATDTTATPEPASLVFIATGLVGIVGIARRRRSA
jgi:hypothetical protein